MTVIIRRKPLLQAVRIAAKIASMNKLSPDRVIARLTYNNDKAVIEATSIEQSCKISVISGAVDNSEPKTVLLQPQVLLDILNKSSGDEVYLDQQDNSIIISDANDNKWIILLPSQNIEFYMNIQDNPEHYYLLSGVSLRDMLPLALASTSASDTLMGVKIQASEDCITIVGTDGRRMAVCQQEYETKIDNPNRPENNLDALMSADFCRLILSVINNTSIMKECFETVPVTQTDKTLQFEFDSDELEIILSSQPFYGRAIPFEKILADVQNGEDVTIGVDALLQAITAVSAVQDAKAPIVQITMTSSNLLKLRTQANEIGSAESFCPVQEYRGSGVECVSSYTTAYLTQFLRVLDKDSNITLRMSGKDNKLAMVTDAGCYIVMPTVHN